ncbi:hypothetical protein PR001_g12600 [Phytophthora rubi]|uniref:VPS9 domain-containing protein n=1 Tax=Phytophthora rubi TaxID=129364 RepID=A0A6A3LSA3_9STRA|nr:hypothetical protein PR002_g12898 [Phytophthora rubi]KAE9024738.1 hypothetical protein PR001_g12600 [Phytophthora rubi]
MDLEEELMDLASNELAYLPSSGSRSSARQTLSTATALPSTDQLTQQVADQLLAQAAQNLALQQHNQQHNQIFTPFLNSDDELLTPEQLQFLAEEDARLERRNAVVRELTAARKAAIVDRLDDLVLQFEQLQQTVSERVDGRDAAEEEEERHRRAVTQQMMTKLEFVVEQSALELRVVDEKVEWTRLLTGLPIEERDYLSRAADEQFMEQMKYLKGDREDEREGAIQQHLHGILVLTAPQRNGQTVAKTSMHHSLRHLLQAFMNIFRGCYADLLQYGGQGCGPRAGVSVDRVTCALPLAAADVTQFAAILAQVVMFKYPFLQSGDSQRKTVQKSVLAALFDALQPALHGLYVASFQREDAILEDVAELCRTNTLEYFEVKPLFRLDGSWSSTQHQGTLPDGNERRLLTLRHYSAAIYHTNNLSSERSPIAKLERLARVCEEIDRAVKSYYELLPVACQPSPEQMNMTTEELCTLLSFILVSAPSSCLHAFTQLALLGSFTPPSIANGREGFALAACMTAVQHLMQLR